MNPIKSEDELKLTHLKDARAVMRWCYDHGKTKGKFPDSDGIEKTYILDAAEKRLIKLATNQKGEK